MPVIALLAVRRLARRRRLLVVWTLRLVLPVTLLRPLAGSARLVPVFLPVVLLLAVAAVTVAMAGLAGALASALVSLRFVLLCRGMRS